MSRKDQIILDKTTRKLPLLTLESQWTTRNLMNPPKITTNQVYLQFWDRYNLRKRSSANYRCMARNEVINCTDEEKLKLHLIPPIATSGEVALKNNLKLSRPTVLGLKIKDYRPKLIFFVGNSPKIQS